LARHLAGRLGEDGVLVNAIAPGPFPSKMMKATLDVFGDNIVPRVPVGRIESAENIAGT
jgi:NAD(P)-dependent dehydrogenase (short-subunit alcohol dehydrogenase family)